MIDSSRNQGLFVYLRNYMPLLWDITLARLAPRLNQCTIGDVISSDALQCEIFFPLPLGPNRRN